MRNNRKAISPVIATIIIVAVAIVMSIAVAYWLMGLGTVFTRYERLEIPVAYAEKKGSDWNVTLHVKNTGSSDATINIILLNGKLDSQAAVRVDGKGYGNLGNATLNISVEAGGYKELIIELSGGKYRSGQSVEITLQTAAGYQYPKSVVLP
ncbi:MAG: archaellin/type IV pilin N-terminal domain-containing protein [Candidatus Bathyarchaeia archaeon]